MKILFVEQAWQDYHCWKGHDRKTFERINVLIREITREPLAGTGKPEPLKHALSGYWSRRLTREHRIVYKVENDTLTLLQLRFQY